MSVTFRPAFVRVGSIGRPIFEAVRRSSFHSPFAGVESEFVRFGSA